MTLSALIKKGGLREIATANLAKAANDGQQERGTLATLATLATADSAKTRRLATLATSPEAEGTLATLATLAVAGHQKTEGSESLSPELESFVRQAFEHYGGAPDELELMLDAARNDVEGATTYYRSLAAELGFTPPTTPKVYCHGCKNLRMEEVYIHGYGGRYFWNCSKNYHEHGRTTPELHNLTAPESCVKAGDYTPIALVAERSMQ